MNFHGRSLSCLKDQGQAHMEVEIDTFMNCLLLPTTNIQTKPCIIKVHLTVSELGSACCDTGSIGQFTALSEAEHAAAQAAAMQHVYMVSSLHNQTAVVLQIVLVHRPLAALGKLPCLAHKSCNNRRYDAGCPKVLLVEQGMRHKPACGTSVTSKTCIDQAFGLGSQWLTITSWLPATLPQQSSLALVLI